MTRPEIILPPTGAGDDDRLSIEEQFACLLDMVKQALFHVLEAHTALEVDDD